MSYRSRARFLLLRLASQNVARRLLRSVFLGLAIMIAVGVGFSGAILGWSLRDGIVTSFSRMGADLGIVPQGTLVNLTSTLLTVQPTELELDTQLGEALHQIPGVAKVAPQRLVEAGVEGRAIRLIAYDPDADFTVEPWLPQGQRRSLAPTGLLVGERVTQKPGEALSVCGRTLTIDGRLGHTGVGPVDESYFLTFAGLEQLIDAARQMRPDGAPAPHETGDSHHHHHMGAECLPDLAPGRVSAFLLQLAPGASLEQARFAIGQIPAIKVVSGNPIFTAARQSLGTLVWGAGAFAALLLMALLFVVSLLFSAIVQERYREIGMLRAMGARPRQIITLTLLEALLITGIGGVAGVVFGISLIFLAARSLGFYFTSLGVPFEGPPDGFIIGAGAASLCFGLMLGLIGALLASRQAMRLEPARMIQMESAP
ncbi:FtsX-like permease family protein [Methylocystis sp. ATCC 49242]|uniref:ABC transporter permease n=1 Tax=Methylocystis sp. ATCC 49242 TaxID=622637 RepID=UPI0001F886CE|nr:ABC transporter permease [Methylocystis sp. ATCC 49242]